MLRFSSLPGASSSGDSKDFELFRISQGGHHSSHLHLFLFTHSLAKPGTHLQHKQLLGGDETTFSRSRIGLVDPGPQSCTGCL
jgi:hypothetical protein